MGTNSVHSKCLLPRRGSALSHLSRSNSFFTSESVLVRPYIDGQDAAQALHMSLGFQASWDLGCLLPLLGPLSQHLPVKQLRMDKDLERVTSVLVSLSFSSPTRLLQLNP